MAQISQVQSEDKPLINISIIGHVDSGKSTLVGRLALDFGCMDKREQDKLQNIAEQHQKSSFGLAFFADKTEQERSRGITIETKIIKMETSKYRVNFLDCPGHADFIKNASNGCKQSDLSIVVVPADFQASCSSDGTLKTHLTLSAILGTKTFIVCINKLDEVAAKNKGNENGTGAESSDVEVIFDAACAAVEALLKKLGVPKSDVIFLPISALKGVGLMKADSAPKFEFFKKRGALVPRQPEGEVRKVYSLEEAIDSQPVPVRSTDKPLRLPISNVAQVPGQGSIICGRVDYGTIKKGDQIKILPVGLIADVKNVQAHRADVAVGTAGMNIGFSLITKDKAALDKIVAGHMVGPASDDKFQLYPFYKIMAVSLKPKGKAGCDDKGIKVGYTPVLSCGTSSIATKFVKLVSILNKTNKVAQENPSLVIKDQKFTAIIYPTKQALYEPYTSYPTLGKFVCRDSKDLVCVGNILECLTEAKAKSEYDISLADVVGAKAAGAKGKK